MMDVFHILIWPFLACLVLTGIHAYLGLHVVERGVIFVDLSLAQVAALGTTIAFLLGFELHGRGAYVFSVGFTLLGAALFALTKGIKSKVPQEAFIGIIYAVSAAASIIIMDRLPEGAEHIKHILVGNLLAVTPHEVMKMAALYSLIGFLHWKWRKPFLLISTDLEGASFQGYPIKVWDFLFYATFGLVVTSSVAIAGVLLVFSFLIVPPVTAMLFFDRVSVRLTFGWIMGVMVSLAGMFLSYQLDTPTGATVVCTFGLSLAFLGFDPRVSSDENEILRKLRIIFPKSGSGKGAVTLLLFLTGIHLISQVEAAEESPPSIQSTDLNLEYTGTYQKPELNQEIIFGPVKWMSTTIGSVPARIWDVNATIEFKKSLDSDKFEALQFNSPNQDHPSPGEPLPMWDQWRHRHGYLFFVENGYEWNSLDDAKKPLLKSDGLFYDQYLKKVWTFWIMKRLSWHLKNSTDAKDFPVQKGRHIFTEKIHVQYDATGLKKPTSMSFRFNAWDTPVMITFNVQPSTSTSQVVPLTYKYRWTYDLDQWRNLHGYQKDFLGYNWIKDFPEETPLTEDKGKKLDDLLNHSISYWVEVVVQQLMIDMDNKFEVLVKTTAE